jgi:hypothetical protein
MTRSLAATPQASHDARGRSGHPVTTSSSQTFLTEFASRGTKDQFEAAQPHAEQAPPLWSGLTRLPEQAKPGIRCTSARPTRPGEPVRLAVDTRNLQFFDPATELAIRIV